MKDSHSAAFRELRDTILEELDDVDRRRLAALLGCMNDAQPALSPALVRALGMIATLDVQDRDRIARWCAAYLSRWGQIPAASSRRIKPT